MQYIDQATIKIFKKKSDGNQKLYFKLKLLFFMIWFFIFSAYLLFIDSLTFEIGKFWLLSYLTFPLIVMLLGGNLYQKSLISIVIAFFFGVWSFVFMPLMEKLNYYDRLLQSGEPTAPLITMLFIPFSIIISIVFLLSGALDTLLRKFRKHT